MARIRENIVFIGLPGSGKSSYGKRIAKDLNLDFADTDELVSATAGMSIPEIFAERGESAFRDMETETLRKLATEDDNVKRGGMVISAGGGIVLRPENAALLKTIGKVVFIDRRPQEISKNADLTEDRPLLRNEADIMRLSEERRALYENAADIVFANDGDYLDMLVLLKSMVELLGVNGDMCLIGNPVSHSLSPALHSVIFEKKHMTASYSSACIETKDLPEALRCVRMGRLRGLNVTKPHKIAVVPFMDELRGDALLAGAVNTVKNEHGRLIGYNTDMEGLALALSEAGRNYRDSVVTILGAGGAAVGIAAKATQEGAKAVNVVCRKLPADTDMFPKEVVFLIHDIAAGTPLARNAFSSTDILINATPLGMKGMSEDFRSFAFLDDLPRQSLVCDLIYEPAETNLLHEASIRSLDTINGLPMLVYQGMLSDEIVFDIELGKTELYKYIRSALLDT